MAQIIHTTYYEHDFALVRRAVYGVQDVFLLILGFRFLLKGLGANPGAYFTQLLYNISQPLVAPFLGVFPSTYGYEAVIEWSTILAMLVYILLAYLLVRALHFLFVPQE